MNLDKQTIEKSKNNKMAIIIIVIGLLVGLMAGGTCYYFVHNSNSATANKLETYYEILDESVLSDKDTLKAWVEENAQNKGAYYTSDDENTYILLSNGATKQQGIGICLEDITIEKAIAVKYSIIKTNSEGEVDEYTPKMIIKVPTKSKNVTFEEVDAK